MTKSELLKHAIWASAPDDAEIVINMDSDQLQRAKDADEYTAWELRPGEYYPKLKRLEFQLTYETL